MNLHRMLLERAADSNPLRIGLIGAGKFGAMYLAQIPTTPGIHLVGIADLSPPRARENLARLGWKPEVTAAGSFAEARAHGNTFSDRRLAGAGRHPEIDIVVESTGDPIAAVEHALEAFRNGKSVVMVTVEADAFCGPLLARRAAEAGVIYSLAYGDQPALICELVDWARASGFAVTAAGRGHKWLPHFAQSTPETVWKYWGLNEEQAKRGGLNPKMFNSFLDGSKPAIESTAVVQRHRPHAGAGRARLPALLGRGPAVRHAAGLRGRPSAPQGPGRGRVARWSATAAPSPTRSARACGSCSRRRPSTRRTASRSTCCSTDPSGRYSVMYKRWHLIGLEVGISVASVGLRKEPTGCPIGFHADVIATAKRDLKPGEMLDGEGGYTVYGKLFPAEKSTGLGSLPLGLAHNVKLLKPIKAGQSLTYADVAMDESLTAVKLRREMEQAFAPAASKIAAQ